MIDDGVKIFQVCIDLAGGIDPDAGRGKILAVAAEEGGKKGDRHAT